MAAFLAEFRPTPETTILDVGGTAFNWSLVDHIRPKLTLLNLPGRMPPVPDWIEAVSGDGCALPYADRSFDIVYSNSVIEHLGCWERQQAFAQEIRRVGRSYTVQTPNRHFPIEPHYLTPLVQFLPPSVQTRMIRNGTVRGWITRPTPEQCRELVDEIRLLTESEMRTLFPEATIQQERTLGLTKSFTAVYRPG